MSPRRRRSAHVATLSVLAAVVVAACGGAVDNGDLFKKQGTTGTSGGTTSPTATASSTPPGVPTTEPAPVPQPQPSPKCDVSFATDVMQVFDQAGCANLQCHGGKFNLPAIDPTSPSLTYKAITSFKLSTGKPYVAVGNTDPEASGMFCNFRGNCGVRMPIGGKLSSTQLDIIDTWLACGAPLN